MPIGKAQTNLVSLGGLLTALKQVEIVRITLYAARNISEQFRTICVALCQTLEQFATVRTILYTALEHLRTIQNHLGCLYTTLEHLGTVWITLCIALEHLEQFGTIQAVCIQLWNCAENFG